MTRFPDTTRHERLFSAIALLLVILLPALVWLTAWRVTADSAQADAKVRFDYQVLRIRDALIARMDTHALLMRAATGLFSASRKVGREEWQELVDGLRIQEAFPGILALGYAQAVSGDRLEAFVAQRRVEGQGGFRVMPEEGRDVHALVTQIEPYSGANLDAIGFDLQSDPDLRAVLQASVRDGKAAMSHRISVRRWGTGQEQAGFLVAVPVFDKHFNVDTPAQRQRAIRGHVFAVFASERMLRKVLEGEREAYVSIIDDDLADKPLLFSSRMPDTGQAASRFSEQTVLSNHGHRWMLHLHSTPEFEETVDRNRSRLVLMGGIALHLLLIGLLWGVWATRARALRLARRMTAEVRRREAEWQAMNDASPLGIFRTDAYGDCQYVNRRFSALAGLAAGAMQGQGWLNAVHPDDRARMSSAWRLAVDAGQQDFDTTGRLLRPDGTVVWTAFQAAAIVDEGGHAGYVGTVEDITARKQATDALIESRDRLGMALEGSNLALFDCDLVSGSVRLSEQWAVMMGNKPAEMVTTLRDLQQFVHREDIPKLQNHLAQVLKGQVQHYEIQHRMRDSKGGWRWILSRAKVTERNGAGRALRMVGTNADITASKEIERLKNDFVATVSHELRTPLTAIIGSLNLVREHADGLDPEVAGFIDMAAQNGERLAALINDVLDIEKIESGQMTVDLRPLPLRAVVEKAVRINQPYADLHQVRLQLEAGPDALVAADADRLMQVLTNLLSNAAKFSPAQSAVSVRLLAMQTVARVEIQDRGPGIADQFRAQIFQRFERAATASTRSKGGTGLGLSISKALIEHMNGMIGFESAEGSGSTFYFELPLLR